MPVDEGQELVEIDRPAAVEAAVAELARKVLEGLTALETGVPVARAAAGSTSAGAAPPVAAKYTAR